MRAECARARERVIAIVRASEDASERAREQAQERARERARPLAQERARALPVNFDIVVVGDISCSNGLGWLAGLSWVAGWLLLGCLPTPVEGARGGRGG